MRVAIAVGLLAVVGALVVAPSAEATGGVYNVVKCHPWHIEADEFESAGGHPSYAFENDCHGASPTRRSVCSTPVRRATTPIASSC